MKPVQTINLKSPNLPLCIALFWLISPQIFYGSLLQPISEPIWFDSDTNWRNKIFNSNPRKRDRVICQAKLLRLRWDGKSKTNQQGRYGFRRRLLRSWKAFVQRLRGTLGAHGANLKHEGRLEAKEKGAGERFYRSYCQMVDWSGGSRLLSGVILLENYEIQQRRCFPSYYSPLHALLLNMMIANLLDGFKRGFWEISHSLLIEKLFIYMESALFTRFGEEMMNSLFHHLPPTNNLFNTSNNDITKPSINPVPRTISIEQCDPEHTTVEETMSSPARMNKASSGIKKEK